VGSLVAIGAARDMVSGRWSRDAVRRLLAIGLPFAVISVAGGLLPAIGRFFLVHFHSLDDAGYYGLAQKIATLLTLLMAGFQAAWAPFAFARRADPDTRRLFATVLLIVGTVVAYASVVLVLLAPWLASTAATAEYGVSVTYVGPLALAAGMSPLFAVVAIGSLFEGRSVHNLVAYMIGLLITVGLNVLLAARHAPPVGIAWASLAGQVAAVVLMAVLSHRVYPVRFPFARLSVLLLAAAGAVAWLGAVVGVLTPGARAVTSALVTLLVLGWIWLAVLEPSHRTRIRRYVRWRSGEAT
jgi:O-antigen/teichoic acid export membrane protein